MPIWEVLKVEDYKFKEVDIFFLRYQINSRLDRIVCIQHIIQQGTKAYYSNEKLLKNKNLSTNTKQNISV